MSNAKTLPPQQQAEELARQASISLHPDDYKSVKDHRLWQKDWQVINAPDVPDWEVSKLVPIIEGIIGSENLVFMAAPTQSRKTLLGLYLALLLDRGGKLFGKFPVTGGHKVLYVVLEDPDRRIKARLLDIAKGMDGEFAADSFDIFIAPRLVINDIECFLLLEEAIVEGDFDVVIIDTYQKATPGISSFEDKEQSLILHRLSNLTRKHHIALIVMDHLRKDMNQGKGRRRLSIDEIKGTGGKAQNADTVILLENVGENRMAFHSFSKDWETPVDILLEVSPQGSGEPKFQYVSDLSTNAGGTEDKDAEILKAFEPGEKVGRKELVTRTKIPEGSIGTNLNRMTRNGSLIRSGEGRGTLYQLPDEVEQSD